jgi:8-oxo-dGTP pyrophosphatase MutT (NUDIX family)
MFGLDELRSSLWELNPRRLRPASELVGRAAVAIIFAGPPGGLSLCFIRRAARENDPWSGHMAFPGGRAEPEDSSVRAIAERETIEEVGLSLESSEYLGPLSELWVRHSGIVTNEVLSPFVYYSGEDHPPLGDSDEVAESYWIGVDHLWSPGNLTTLDYQRPKARVRLPGIRHNGNVIWGLTYMMLHSLGEVVGAPLPPPEAEKL